MASAKPWVLLDSYLHPNVQPILDAAANCVLVDDETAVKAHKEDVVAFFSHGHYPCDAALVTAFPNIKVVSNHGVGCDHIDVAEMHKRGILVGNTPGVVAPSTADLAMALLLASARKIVWACQAQQGMVKFDPTLDFADPICGSTVGVVGLGAIGSKVAKRCRMGFDMTVLYNKRTPLSKEEENALGGVCHRALDDLLAEADYVVLCMPLNDSTRGMFNADLFKKMKKSACLINVGRGGLVDHEALVAALDAGEIANAALDVTDPEPLPKDHPLIVKHVPQRCIVLPHLGTAELRTRTQMCEMAIENMLGGLGEGKMKWAVSPL